MMFKYVRDRMGLWKTILCKTWCRTSYPKKKLIMLERIGSQAKIFSLPSFHPPSICVVSQTPKPSPLLKQHSLDNQPIFWVFLRKLRTRGLAHAQMCPKLFRRDLLVHQSVPCEVVRLPTQQCFSALRLIAKGQCTDGATQQCAPRIN